MTGSGDLIVWASRMKAKSLLGTCLSVSLLLAASGAESNLRPDDVIALIGGEDMVALAESGVERDRVLELWQRRAS